MWVIAGVLLGVVVLAALLGFHVGPHAHVVAGVFGALAAVWLLVMALDGRTAPVLWALLGADLVVSAGVATVAWKGLTTNGGYVAGRRLVTPVGAEGVAVGDLAPDGIVRVNGENWSAVAANGTIRAGSTVEVLSVSGVRLEVWSDDALASPGPDELESALSENSAGDEESSPEEATHEGGRS